MKINKNINLFLRDVYLYDIEACHYNILKKIGYDVSNIDFHDKKKRNIQIGLLMRKNPHLTTLLRNTTKSIIDEYIEINKLKEEEDIILRQYDGIITTRLLKINDLGHIKLGLRKHFQIFISSFERDKYIALDNNNEVTIKGVAHRYEKIDLMLKKLCRIRFSNKIEIFQQLQNLRDEILKSKDAQLFAIPVNEEIFHVFFKEYGELEIKKSIIEVLDTDDIDKEKYFKIYLEPFTKSIVLENV